MIHFEVQVRYSLKYRYDTVRSTGTIQSEIQVWHSPNSEIQVRYSPKYRYDTVRTLKYRYDTVRNTGMTQSELRNTGTIQSISLCLFTGQDITEHSHFDWHVSGFPGWAGGLQKSLLGNICWSSIFQSVAMQKAEQQLIHNGSKT